MATPLSAIAILAEAERLLKQAQYVVRREMLTVEPNVSATHNALTRLSQIHAGRWLWAEDAVAILAIVVYDHLNDLLTSWNLAQGAVVDLISKRLSTSDPKLWDGYLVLINPSHATVEGKSQLEKIRHDVSRVRKIVATGDELHTISDVERILLPFLPINVGTFDVGPASLLEILPSLLAKEGVPIDSATAVVEAFKKQEPLLEKLFKKEIE